MTRIGKPAFSLFDFRWVPTINSKKTKEILFGDCLAFGGHGGFSGACWKRQ
jgi:hypothetical protein